MTAVAEWGPHTKILIFKKDHAQNQQKEKCIFHSLKKNLASMFQHFSGYRTNHKETGRVGFLFTKD